MKPYLPETMCGDVEPLRPARRAPLRRTGLMDAEAQDDQAQTQTSPSSRWIVCVAEIDRFAILRGRLGYEVANALIGEYAERIGRSVAACKLGRVGRTSVEFAFRSESTAAAQTVLHDLVAEIERPCWVADVEFDLTVTIGAVDIGDREIDDRKLDAAAATLRIAQERHEKVRVVADGEAQIATLDDLSLVRDLRRALTNGGLALHYQPKLRARTETIDSAEALLRWHHPTLGPVRIDKLIELAEATGAIRELTFWVLERALADRQVLAAAGQPLTIFVNISGLLLPDTGFADWALDRLRGHPGTIGFEITETAIIEEPTVAIHNLQRFAEAGIKIAIDDYGSGLSSLAYLKQLPAHELKIDRMFVKGLTETQRDPLLVRSSIDLAHALEMEVTAEGVDDQMSLSLLRVMGCDMVQGYLISHPLPLSELQAFLTEGRHHGTLAATATALAQWSAGVAAQG